MLRITTREAIDKGRMHFSLEEYHFLLRRLDIAFGGPNKEKRYKNNGQERFHDIVEYLAYHGNSTSRQIAEYQVKQRIPKQKEHTGRFVRTIADKNNRFIQDHQEYQIFTPVETKIKSNSGKGRDSTPYRLTIFGVLYAIHFLSKDEYFSHDHHKLIKKIIKANSEEFSLLSHVLGDDSKIFETHKEACVTSLLQIAKGRVLNMIEPDVTISNLLWKSIDFVKNENGNGKQRIKKNWSKRKKEQYWENLLSDEGRMKKQVVVAFFAIFQSWLGSVHLTEDVNSKKFSISEINRRQEEYEKVTYEIWWKIIKSDPDLKKFFKEHLKFSNKVAKVSAKHLTKLVNFMS